MSKRELTAEETIRQLRRKENLYTESLNRGKIVDTSGRRFDHPNARNLNKIMTPREIKDQAMNINGHMVKMRNDLKKGDFLAECYDEFLRMYQLFYESAKSGKVIRSVVSGKPIGELKFIDWVKESKDTMQWRKEKEIPKLMRHNKISKDVFKLNIEICKIAIEACDDYLHASEKTALMMV